MFFPSNFLFFSITYLNAGQTNNKLTFGYLCWVELRYTIVNYLLIRLVSTIRHKDFFPFVCLLSVRLSCLGDPLPPPLRFRAGGYWRAVVKLPSPLFKNADMLHVKLDMWQVTCDPWREVNILSNFQFPSSSSWEVKVEWRFGGKGLVS